MKIVIQIVLWQFGYRDNLCEKRLFIQILKPKPHYLWPDDMVMTIQSHITIGFH